MSKHITLTVDYHDRACVIRWFDHSAGRDQVFSEVPTTKEALNTMVEKARLATGRQGSVTWLQESTTGWARVQALVADRAQFLLANVLQMPLPPKGRRRKTDKVDTARLQREYLNGSLPLAYQPPAEWRQLRRLVGYREGLVKRRTALRNWINRYLAHETWFDCTGLWSPTGQKRLRVLLKRLPRTDALVIGQKLDELARLEEQLEVALTELVSAYGNSPEAEAAGCHRRDRCRVGGIDRGPNRARGAVPNRGQSDRLRRAGAGHSRVGPDATERPDRRRGDRFTPAALLDRGHDVAAQAPQI